MLFCELVTLFHALQAGERAQSINFIDSIMVVEIEKRYNLFFFVYLINQDERSANVYSSLILQMFNL